MHAAVSEDRKCLALERKWAGVAAEAKGKVAAVPGATVADATKKVDALVDRTLTAVRDNAESQRAGAAEDDPIHATVIGFLKAIYPSGLQEVTSLPYVEELAAVEDILEKVASPQLAPVVEELHLGKLVERLGTLTKQYRAALHMPEAAQVIAFSDVRAARAAGQERLLQAVAMIVGKHFGSTPKDIAARADLLEPILKQNVAIGAAMKGRATVTDVNPETGEPGDLGAVGTAEGGATEAGQKPVAKKDG